jgi:Tol biopolymer transport system component
MNATRILAGVGLFVFLYDGEIAVCAIMLNDSTVGSVRDFQISRDDQRVVYSTMSADGTRFYSRLLFGQHQSALLNDTTIRRDSSNFGISPDGEWVVMQLQDGSPVTSQDIFSRRIDGSGALFDLTGELVTTWYTTLVGSVKFVPGRNDVVINATENGLRGLYIGPVDGTAGLRLIANPPLPRTDIERFLLTADGQNAVLVSGGAYRIPLEGIPSLTKLTGDLRAIEVQIAPDGSRIVFDSKPGVFDPWTFYSAPVDGSSPPTALGGPASQGNQNTSRTSQIAGNSSLIFLSDQEIINQFELYSRPLDGSALATKLNDPLVVGSDVIGFSLTPDGKSAFFSTSDQDGDGMQDYYLAPVDGNVPTREIELPVPSGQYVDLVFIAPDNQTAVYTSLRREGNFYSRQLFSVPLDGSGPAASLSPNVTSTQSVADVGLSPDGRNVVFGRDINGWQSCNLNCHLSFENHDLFVIPIKGGIPRIVNDPLSADPLSQLAITRFQFAANGSTVLYMAERLGGFEHDLFAAVIAVPELASLETLTIGLICLLLHSRVRSNRMN